MESDSLRAVVVHYCILRYFVSFDTNSRWHLLVGKHTITQRYVYLDRLLSSNVILNSGGPAKSMPTQMGDSQPVLGSVDGILLSVSPVLVYF